MAFGRPTEYNPSMCNTVLEKFSEGWSKEEIAVELGIAYQSFLNYQKKHPEFLEAVKEGERLAKAWWLRQGREGLTRDKFNFVGWSMQVRNRFSYHTDEQPVKVPKLKASYTFTEKVNTIIDAAKNGDITLSEAKKLAEIVAIGAKIEEVTELKKIIEEIEESRKGE